MLRYIIKRLLMLILVMIGVVALVFFFQAISDDDPAIMILGPGASEEQLEAKRAELGLDQPVIVQFGRYLWNFVTKGDLGKSYINGQDILTQIMDCFPYTLVLAFGAVFLGVIIGIPLGVISAVKQYTWIDNTILAFSVLMSSFPSFWLALLLIVLFSITLGWLPASGVMSFAGWILPCIAVMVQSMANLVRTTRSSMLETIRQDYVRTARAKGQKERVVVIRHAFRNSLIPILNAIGVSIGTQLGGALIIENIFGIPGIGQYAVTAINNRNYPAVRGSVIVLSLAFTIVNLLIDLTYTAADPRLKATFAGSKKSRRKKKKAVQQTENSLTSAS